MDKDNKKEKKEIKEKSKFSLQLEKAKTGFSNFTNKISKSINKTINGIDEKTNPKVGRILNDVFKWSTISIYILALPLLVLISQVVNTKDYMKIEVNSYVVQSLQIDEGVKPEDATPDTVTVANNASNKDEKYTYVLSYEEFDKSLEEIWNGQVSDDNLFRTAEITTINKSDAPNEDFDLNSVEYGYSLFYALYHPYNTTDYVSTTDYINQAIAYQSADAQTYKDDTVEYLQVHYFADNEYQDINDVKEGFRIIYPPQASTEIGAVGEEPIVVGSEQAEIITGWTLFSVGIVTGVLWFWFSKYSKVSLKNNSDKDQEEEKTEGAKS